MREVRIVDCTIRDGGYEISHQFDQEDVALVVSTLEAAGTTYIEIGCGLGVGTHLFPTIWLKERPIAGDQAHMHAARAAARRAKVGVLYVAGDQFCPVEYLDEVAAAKMDFVRLAFMPSDITRKNLRYIERARELGLIVSINCMQTYILPPDEIVKLARMCQSAGAQWWYVVDSAGGMQPSETRKYVRAIVDACDIEVGLHAHNNLGLAVANSLAAVEEGATLVDCTLNGLGRATGNAPTEQLTLALQNMGHETEIDVEPLTRLSEMYRVLFEGKGNDPINFVSGAAMLHSRNVPAVVAQAKERGVSLADFMVRVGREARKENCLDKSRFPTEVFDRAATHCKKPGSTEPGDALMGAIAERLANADQTSVERVCEMLAMRAARYHVPSVLHVVPDRLFPFGGPLPWQSEELVGVTIPWSEAAVAGNHRPCDFVIADRSLATREGLPTARVRRFTFAWDDLWQDAIRAVVASIGDDSHLWLSKGDDRTLPRIGERLRTAGHEVDTEPSNVRRGVLVASSTNSAAWLDRVRSGDLVILIDRGPSARRAVDQIRKANARALTPPVAGIIAARVQEQIQLWKRLAPMLAEPSTHGWVDPAFAPGEGEAVVDVALSTIVEAGAAPRETLVTEVARVRGRALVKGTGTP